MKEHRELQLLNWWVKSIKLFFGEETENGIKFPSDVYYAQWREEIIKKIDGK